MKTFLALFFASTPAFAFPAVGDKVVFAVKVEQSSGVQTGTLTQEITQRNETQKLWLEVDTLVLGDAAPQASQAWHKDNEMQSPQRLSMLLKACSLAGGKPADVDVPAGHFSTCVIASGAGLPNSEQYWAGMVPFGVVEFVTTQNGRRNTGVLTSVRAP